MNLWLLLAGMGLITYAIRAVPILLMERVTLPPLVMRGLRFVPPAVLSAVVLPELVRTNGTLNLSPANPRLLAGLLAAAVAWRTRNVLLTILAGMLALWALQWLASAL
jgi:branched-subunit amino acid transport protein